MFGSKKVKAATQLSTEIDGITKAFTTMVDSLNQKAQEANDIKNAKEEEINILMQECDDLKSVSDKALNLASKIANIFN